MADVTRAQIEQFADGILEAMNGFQERIEDRILAEAMPLIGTGMAAAASGQAALRSTSTLGQELATALDALSGAATQTQAAVESALESALQAAGFAGTAVTVTTSGGVARIVVATQKIGQYVQDLAGDLALAGLDAVGAGSGLVDTAFDYLLEFGSDGSSFFVDTGAATEVAMTVSLGSVSFDPDLSVGGQDFVALDAGTSFSGTIGIDLQSGTGQLNGAQVASATVTGTMDATAELNVEITAKSQGDMTPPITANLTVDWDFDDAAINPDDSNVSFGDRPEVAFDTVRMDLGAFMEDFVDPLIGQVYALLEPIEPILDILTASIKVLEDFPGLGNVLDATGDGRVTLLDLMALKFPSADVAGLEAFANAVLQVADWADFLKNQAFASGDLVLGSFDLGSADIRTPGFDLNAAIAGFQGAADDLNSIVASLTGTGWNRTDPGSGMNGREILQSMLGDGLFDLPVLTDPSQWMNLFMGQVADLVEVDLPDVSFTTGQKTILKFPIFPLVALEVTGEFGVDFNFDFGFDTRGFQTPGLNAIDGFYMIDAAGSEIELFTKITMGIEAGVAGVLTATGEGDVTGTLMLDLADDLQVAAPGKLYYDEFTGAFSSNPFSIFDASGSITAGFSAVIDSLLGEVWRWDSPRVTLGNFGFEGEQDKVNPKLAAKSGGDTLTLNIGDRAGNRTFGALPAVTTEYMTLTAGTKPNEVILQFLGLQWTYKNITHVKGDAKHEADAFQIQSDLLITVDYSGGSHADIIEGAALNDTLEGNAGDDALFGRAGNDQLYGGNTDDFLDGGEGADTIDGGSGVDRATYLNSSAAVQIDLDSGGAQSGGEAQGDILTSIEIVDGSRHDDSITGSHGDGILMGQAGNDTLRSGSHTQALFGNAGDDELEGSGNDTLSGGEGDDTYIVRSSNVWINENEIDEIEEGSDSGYDFVKAHVSVDLSVSDAFIEKITLFGIATDATANDRDNLINGNANDNRLDGRGGDDTIYGKDGDDTIYGGNGDNELFGGDGKDTILAATHDDLLRGGADGDFLSGSLGDDTVYGDDGQDTIYGELGDNILYGGKGIDSIYGGDDTDKIYAGNGNDRAYGGMGNDTIYSGGGHDVLESGADDDKLYAGTGLDQLDGGSGDDTLFGGRGADYLVGNTGADKMYGGLEADYYKADGSDSIYEILGGGLDYVFATEDLVLLAGQEVDILSTYDLHGKLWGLPWYEPGGVVRAEGFYALSYVHGTRGPLHTADLTGNELKQVLIADLGDGDVNVRNDLEGMGGADTLVGDTQRDFAVYAQSDAAVNIDLSFAEQTGGHAEGDYLYGIRHLIGSAFDDTLKGEEQAAAGGFYDNEIYGGDGADLIYGFEGRDTLYGGAGKDTIYGGDDYDSRIYGGDGKDELFGGQGFDSLYGGAGIDTMDGGAADDLYHVTLGDRLIDSAGNDTVVATEDYFLQAGVEIEHLIAQEGGSPQNIAIYGNTFAQELIGNSADNYLHGGNGADTITGGDGRDTASYLLSSAGVTVNLASVTQSGGAAAGDRLFGIEELQGSGHDDVLIGNANTGDFSGYDDEHFGFAGNDRIEDRLGQNTLHGGLGDDTLVGSGYLGPIWGNGSLLDGGDGNDSLDGGVSTSFGGDTMAGGLGDDIYRVTSQGDFISENFMGDIGAGEDGGRDTVISDVETWSMDTPNQADIEDAELGSGLNLTANALDNSVIGNELENSISGLDGNDTLEGLGGNDTLLGGNGDDLLRGGGGDDTLNGGSNNDTLFGAAGDDTLNGGSGNDSLHGGIGADIMTGGSGNDTMVVDDLGDIATDNLNGGHDLVRSSVTWTLSSNIEDLTLIGTSAINGAGNDLDNTLRGNSAANLLNGKLGNDTMTGGDGADIFLFNTALGAGNVDEITDFQVGIDLMRLNDTQFTGMTPGALAPGQFRASVTGSRWMRMTGFFMKQTLASCFSTKTAPAPRHGSTSRR